MQSVVEVFCRSGIDAEDALAAKVPTLAALLFLLNERLPLRRKATELLNDFRREILSLVDLGGPQKRLGLGLNVTRRANALPDAALRLTLADQPLRVIGVSRAKVYVIVSAYFAVVHRVYVSECIFVTASDLLRPLMGRK